jgi:aryl-alcohol dehydrogenase-like predicted oxidoreductase
MNYVKLGSTGISVSEMAFGTLTMGPLQRNISDEEGGTLIRLALEQGINFLDTAQNYGTYGHMKVGLEGFSGDVVIASKSNKKDYQGMADAVEECRLALDRDVIDIFLMHAVQREDDLDQRQKGAWQSLLDLKAKGVVKAIGLSTHSIDIVETVALWPDLDVIHPIFNKINFGLINPDLKDPKEIIRLAFEKGKGIFAMKPLAGGHLYREVGDALRYVFDFPYMHAVAVGMVKPEELAVNLKLYHGEDVSTEEMTAAGESKRMLISVFCKGCGKCVDACEHSAISMVDEKAYIEHSHCVLCGYCRKACVHSAIRIV